MQQLNEIIVDNFAGGGGASTGIVHHRSGRRRPKIPQARTGGTLRPACVFNVRDKQGNYYHWARYYCDVLEKIE